MKRPSMERWNDRVCSNTLLASLERYTADDDQDVAFADVLLRGLAAERHVAEYPPPGHGYPRPL